MSRVAPHTPRALVLLAESGSTPKRVYEQLIAEGFDVSHTAVESLAQRNRRAIPRKSVDAGELIPWQVDERHQGAHAPQMLRHLARLQQGMFVTEDRRAALAAWLSGLQANSLVIDYNPVNGWLRVPRRRWEPVPGVTMWIDGEVIKDPRRADDGTIIG